MINEQYHFKVICKFTIHISANELILATLKAVKNWNNREI